MATKKDLIEHLEWFRDDEELVWHLWSEDDVMTAVKQREEEGEGEPVSIEEAKGIIREISDNIDNDCGITWGTIHHKLSELFDERKKKNG